jgi:hypothetical protein
MAYVACIAAGANVHHSANLMKWHTSVMQRIYQAQMFLPPANHLQIRIAGSLTLVTPAEELSTYRALLELQPYLDERLVGAVQELASQCAVGTALA